MRSSAAELVKLHIADIRGRGETPFLQALTSNRGAIAVYRALAFVERREMRVAVLGPAKV